MVWQTMRGWCCAKIYCAPNGSLRAANTSLSEEERADSGGEATVIEMTEHLGKGLHATRLYLTLERLQKSKVTVMPNTRLQSVDGGLAYAETTTGPVTLGPFDSIVMAVGYRSEASLAREPGLKPQPVVIGDALQPRSIYEAVKEGFDAAVGLDS